MKRKGILILMAISLVMSACKKKGCTDSGAINYNASAEKDDGTCEFAPGTVSVELTDNIDVPTILEAGDYTICFDFYINSELTLLPGCNLIMCDGSSITVASSGYLNATGTLENPIKIKGAVSTKGYWQGLAIKSNNPNNKLIHVELSDGGTYWAWEYANVYVNGNGQLNISESTISNSDNVGLFIENGGFLSNFSENTFSNNTVGLSLRVDQVKHIDSESVYNLNNTYDYIDARSGTIATNAVWQALNTPLLVNDVTVTGSLIVNPGSNILVEAGGIFYIEATGYLTTNGTATEPVIIKGRYSSPAYWNGMRINSNNPNNKMTYTLISDGGAYWAFEYANIYVNGNLDISNSIIQNANSYGIYVNSTGSIFGNGTGVSTATQLEAINTFIDNGTGPDANCTSGCTAFFE